MCDIRHSCVAVGSIFHARCDSCCSVVDHCREKRQVSIGGAHVLRRDELED